MTSLLSLLLAGLLIFAVYRTYYGLMVATRRRKAVSEHGCKPINSKYPHKDPIFGLDLFFTNASAAVNRRFLSTINGRFAALGNTYQLNNFGENG